MKPLITDTPNNGHLPYIRLLQLASRFLVPRTHNFSDNAFFCHYTYIVCTSTGVACSPMRPFFSPRAIITPAMFLVFKVSKRSQCITQWIHGSFLRSLSAVLSLRNNDIMSKPAHPLYYLGKARTRNRNTTWSGLTDNSQCTNRYSCRNFFCALEYRTTSEFQTTDKARAPHDSFQ